MKIGKNPKKTKSDHRRAGFVVFFFFLGRSKLIKDGNLVERQEKQRKMYGWDLVRKTVQKSWQEESRMRTGGQKN